MTEQAKQAISVSKAPAMTPMTSEQFKAAIEELGLALSDAAILLGVHPRTTRRWANAEREIPPPVCNYLHYLMGAGVKPDNALRVAQKAAQGYRAKPRKRATAPTLNAVGKPYGENYDPNYRMRHRTRTVPRHQTNIGPGISPERWEVLCREARKEWDARHAAPPTDEAAS